MLDEVNCRYFLNDGEIVDLTVKQNRLLKTLIENKGRIVSYKELCKQVYKLEADKNMEACIRKTVCDLKKKINIEIMSRRGVGDYIPQF
jgi:DNA-binding response OmpR family regulator